MKLGFAFAGPLFTPPWPSGSLAQMQPAKAAGADWCSIPVWYGADLTKLRSMVDLALALGLAPFVPLHVDVGTDEAVRLMPYLDAERYSTWAGTVFTSLLGTGCIVGLWNEAEYNDAQAATHRLTWTSMQALYTELLPTLASEARSEGLRVSVPLPLDQSPEEALQLADSGYFPFDAIQRVTPDFVDAHLYPVASGTLRSRVATLLDFAGTCGAPLLVSETHPAPGATSIPAYRITDWEAALRGVARCYWQWSSDPASPSDAGSLGFLAALRGA